MIDLRTRDGALRFAELRRDEMRRQFERAGIFEVNGFALCAHVFHTHDIDTRGGPGSWRTGARLSAVEARLVTVPTAAADYLTPATLGPIFAETLRQYCRLGRAVGVVVMTEQWWGRTQSPEERAGRPRRIADWDDRREVLYLNVQHQAVGIRSWRAEIHRDPLRVDPWQLDGEMVSGNLARLLDLKETAPS